MKTGLIVLAAAAVGALTLAGCDDYQSSSQQTYVEEAPVEEPVAPAAADSAEPVVAPDVVDPTPQPEPLPPQERTSEESVQPESETLFY